MSKLNAFLAAIPANGLPSPTASKDTSAPADKAFPSLTITPQVDSSHDDDGMIAVDEPQKVPQPATPQPQFQRHRGGSSRKPRSGSVRDIARRFDSQKSFSAASPSSDEAPSSTNSNQEDEAAAERKNRPSLPPLSPVPPQASTPIKTLSSSSTRRSLDDGEAEPLKRLSLTHQLQQQQQQQGQHHRRISTDTAMFSKMLKKQPHEDIDARVVHFFSQLSIPTVSRPDHTASSNQHDEPHTQEETVDPLELLAIFKRGETVSVETALSIIMQATNLLSVEPNVVAANAPFTVVGDLHGQFFDLVELFHTHGTPSPSNPYLFLGDYVDRGVASCEILLLLLAYKVRFPRSVLLLRGNHECRSLSTFYGFRHECLRKYGLAVYNRTIKCFESMPLAATIATASGTFLAVHGGLSPSIDRVEQINELIDRFAEPDPSGALCDLLWADPAKDASAQREQFKPNAVRGCSFTFSEQVCREFLARNNLLAIIRAHELEEHGFHEHFQSGGGEEDRLPPVVTVFSAPEYCNTNHNMGATLAIPWETTSAQPKRLVFRQHTRSTRRETAFTGASEHEAVLAFLSEQLPFLPVDFYALVAVCRQLQATLDVAAAVATPTVSSASNVIPPLSFVETEPAKTVTEPMRRSVDHTSTQGDSGLPVISAVAPRHSVIHISSASHPRMAKPQHRRASTGSPKGLRLCPGFVRFCEKFLGVQFQEQPFPAPRTTCIIEPKKRRSIDDINIGTTTQPPPPAEETRPVVEALPPAHVGQICLVVEQPDVPLSNGSSKNNLEIFSMGQWTALRLFFSLLDVSGSGVLMEESFVVLLAEQDSDAYATQDELQLLMDVVDGNGDGLITSQDFLQFAYRAFLRWKKNSAPRRASSHA